MILVKRHIAIANRARFVGLTKDTEPIATKRTASRYTVPKRPHT